MKRIKVVADDKIPFLRGVLEPVAEVVYLPGGKIRREDLKSADALLTRTRTFCNRELLEGTAVKFIATATIGYDHIDTAYCDAAGIRWCNAPGCNAGSVQQYIVSALVNLAAKHNFALADKTLGIVGVGNVGTKVLQAAHALGMKTVLCDPPRQERGCATHFVPLLDLLADADIVTLHVPLNLTGPHKTLQMADDRFFADCRNGVFFLNAARGEVCSGEALKKAIKSGQVSGAVLDVWENEPDIDRELLGLVDYGTPHIAGYSADGKANGTAMVVRALSRFFDLGLDAWTVPQVPLPPETGIKLVPGQNETAAIHHAVNQSYDIAEDCARLRATPEQFEQLRGDYPLRREFGAYKVGNEYPVLKKLGFDIK